MGNRIAVIADDLTGANDAGVQFAKQGLSTAVIVDEDSLGDIKKEKVVVIHTGSRSLSAADAYNKVAHVSQLLKAGQFRTVFKKVDSTLRGNLGAEIDAIMDTCGQDAALVAAAFPQNGRVTVAGYHLLQSAPLEATEIVKDPCSPVSESHLPTLLQGQTRRQVGHIGIKDILGGVDAVFAKIQTLLAAGKTVLACDAWQNEQLALIAQAGSRLARPLLWVGSAGLAEFLPQALGLAAVGARNQSILVIAGSMSKVTRGQVARLRQRFGVTCIKVDPCALLRPDTKAVEIERCLTSACTGETSGDLVVTTIHDDEVLVRTRTLGSALGYSGQRISQVIAEALGEVGGALITHRDIKGLVLTGGDTVMGACRALGATGFTVIREIAPGIPLGRLRGGARDGLPIVTKAGAFGDNDALGLAVDNLNQEAK